MYFWIEIFDQTKIDTASEDYARGNVEFYFDADNESDRCECKIAWKAKHDIPCKSPDYPGVIQMVEQ